MKLRNFYPAALIAAMIVAAPVSAQVGANLGLVNPNLASVDEIAAVDGISAATAAAIVAGRPYLRMAAVHAVVAANVAADDTDTVYRGLWLPIDLNDVTDAEIRLIPGVGDRMLHEFREYAPFAGLAVFHREIDKYVDDAELARLEQYVYVRINPTTASDADILSIPGIGARMLREFKEYRPWTALAQFRREMGKYVDATEVARMERYITIRPL